jgi:hypothetical protein
MSERMVNPAPVHHLGLRYLPLHSLHTVNVFLERLYLKARAINIGARPPLLLFLANDVHNAIT